MSLKEQQQKSKFLPMLCSSTPKKEVKLSHRPCSSSVLEEPSSPRVGCTGQVKRNNKVVGFSGTISLPAFLSVNATAFNNSTLKKTEHHHSCNAVKYHRGRTTNTTTTKGRTYMSRATTDHRSRKTDEHHGTATNLEELDPPLPVMKQVQKQKQEEGSLWKRRTGGAPLKSLQVQTCTLPSANTV